MSISAVALRKSLREIKKTNPCSIKAFVAEQALTSGNVKDFFNELFQFGCESGIVNGLTHYRDTHAFFERHYIEIETLRQDYAHISGDYLTLSYDLKNAYAWFGFEQTAYLIIKELGL